MNRFCTDMNVRPETLRLQEITNAPAQHHKNPRHFRRTRHFRFCFRLARSADRSRQPGSDAYGKIIDNGFQLPAIPIQKLDKKFHRQIVDFQTKESAGTVS